jgi:D-psicose/D-tagatose/L-ribulose 3-epimerase
MKIGMNLLLWTTHVTEQHFPIIARLKQTGFDGVEIPIFEFDANHFKRIGKELRNQGLACTAVTVATPEENPISPDAAVRKKAVDRLHRAVEMTVHMGGDKLCGPYHSPLAVFTGSGPTPDEKSRAAEVLRQAAEDAQKSRVQLVMEYLNRFECYFLTTAADAKALVQRVDHPNFKTMYDTFHANIEEKSPSQAITTLGSDMVHVHISESDRGTPGTGMVHWAETWQALKKARYDGWLTIEAFGRALPDLAAATRVWRDLFPSAEEVYTHGLKFIKQNWG